MSAATPPPAHTPKAGNSDADQGLLARIGGMLLHPRQSWQAIAAEDDSIARIYRSHLVWLLLLASVCGFIGSSLIGVGAFGITVRMPIAHGLLNIVVGFALALVMAYLMAWLASALAPRFGGTAHLPAAFKLLAYSATAALLGSVFQLVPWLGVLGLVAGLYSIYLFYLGAPVLLKVQRVGLYTLVFVVCAAVAGLLVGGLVSLVMPGMPEVTHPRSGTEIRLPSGRTVDAAKMEGLAEQLRRAEESGSTADQAAAIGGLIAAATSAATTRSGDAPAPLEATQQAIVQAEQKMHDARERGDTRAAADSFGEAMAAAAKAMQIAEANAARDQAAPAQAAAAAPAQPASSPPPPATPATPVAPGSLAEQTGLNISPETEATLRAAQQRMQDIESRLATAQAQGDQMAMLALTQELVQAMQDPAIQAATQELVQLQMQAAATQMAAHEAQTKAQTQAETPAPAAPSAATGAGATATPTPKALGLTRPLEAAQLRSLLPEQLVGLPRTRIQARSQSPEQAPEITLSTLTARYENADQRVQVKLQDVGGPPGVAEAQADWRQHQGQRETPQYREHIYAKDAMMVREQHSRNATPNRLTLLLPTQLLLELEGPQSIDQLHALAQQLNLAAMQHLQR